MVHSAQARVAGLLLLMAVLAWSGADSALPGTHIGSMWPVGLAAGILVHSPRAWRWTVSGLILLIAFASYGLTDHTTAVSLGYAVSITVEALVVQQVLTGGWHERRRLRGETDLVGFMLAALSGALVGGLLFGATSLATGFGTPWMVALATVVAHLTSQLILLAFFLEDGRAFSAGGGTERVIRWLVAIAVTTAAFIPTGVPTLVFLVLPILAWTALRATMREALWHLLAILTIASTLTQFGLGPFGDLPATTGWPADLAVLPFYAFLLGCALVSIPFAMAVRRQRTSAAEAATERKRFQRIVEAATTMAIIETDARGRITLFNPGAEALLQYHESEVLGRSPAMFHSAGEFERQAEILGTGPGFVDVSLASALPENGPRDWRFIRKDGVVRTMSMSLVPITDDSGVVTGYLATAEDITDRVRTLEALETALATERTAVAQLKEVDRTKDAFVSSVSHELRTPITNIVGYLELLLEGSYGETTPAQHEALDRIDLNSHRLLELIDDLLTLSSIEALDVHLSREPVDLREVLQRTVAKVQRAAELRRQRLDFQLPTHPVVVLGDSTHLERMVSTLAANAVKFTPDGGTVTLRVLNGDQTCAIEVQDTGIGIPDDEQPHLFNRFYRSRYAQQAAIQGSGLGLSIARTIAELHGARISASSAPGHGSLFRVAFPEQRASSDSAQP